LRISWQHHNEFTISENCFPNYSFPSIVWKDVLPCDAVTETFAINDFNIGSILSPIYMQKLKTYIYSLKLKINEEQTKVKQISHYQNGSLYFFSLKMKSMYIITCNDDNNNNNNNNSNNK
jgi:hypothetical protein